MTPSIQSLLDSTSKRFDEEFDRSKALDGDVYFSSTDTITTRRERIQAFLLQSNLELLAAVRDLAEGMKKEKLGTDQFGTELYSSGTGDMYYNQALDDLITALSEGKENV